MVDKLEDGSELRLVVMRGKECPQLPVPPFVRWMLSGPVWKREIKVKKQGGAISNIKTYIVVKNTKENISSQN